MKRNFDMSFFLKQYELHEEVVSAIEDACSCEYVKAGSTEILSRLYEKTFYVVQGKSRGGYYERIKNKIGIHEAFLNENIKTNGGLEVLLHEIAHMIQYEFTSQGYKKPHGSVWKSIMRHMGQKPTVIISANSKATLFSYLNRTNNSTNNHLYTCQKCGKEYKTKRKLKGTVENIGLAEYRRHINCGGTFEHKRI